MTSQKDDSSGAMFFLIILAVCLYFIFAGSLIAKIISISVIVLIILGVIAYYYFQAKEERKLEDEKIKKENNIIQWNDKPFGIYLGEEILSLRYDSILLIREFKKGNNLFTDYSFIVSPMAKAYEGFLKKILVDVGVIKKEELKRKPGLAVNKYFHPVEGIMLKYVSDIARERAIPAVIYTVYQECRNEIMHFDLYQHHSKKRIKDIGEAEFFIKRIEDAIEKAYYTFIEPLEKNKK